MLITGFITATRPKFLAGISDNELRVWAEEMHKTWKALSRKVIGGHMFDEMNSIQILQKN